MRILCIISLVIVLQIPVRSVTRGGSCGSLFLIGEKKKQYAKGKNDLFAVVIVLKYLLSDEEFCEFIEELRVIIEKLLEETNMIQVNQIYKYMGFPENWLEIRECPKYENNIDITSIQ